MQFQDTQLITPIAVAMVLKHLMSPEKDYTITFGSTICHRNTGTNWTDLETEVSARLLALPDFTVTYTQDEHHGVAKFEKNTHGYFKFDFSWTSTRT